MKKYFNNWRLNGIHALIVVNIITFAFWGLNRESFANDLIPYLIVVDISYFFMSGVESFMNLMRFKLFK